LVGVEFHPHRQERPYALPAQETGRAIDVNLHKNGKTGDCQSFRFSIGWEEVLEVKEDKEVKGDKDDRKSRYPPPSFHSFQFSLFNFHFPSFNFQLPTFSSLIL
jgi:hypothetical protein